MTTNDSDDTDPTLPLVLKAAAVGPGLTLVLLQHRELLVLLVLLVLLLGRRAPAVGGGGGRAVGDDDNLVLSVRPLLHLHNVREVLAQKRAEGGLARAPRRLCAPSALRCIVRVQHLAVVGTVGRRAGAEERE